jgi:metal-responsive CopG/Arc/MetJ family transcriptional regulator
VAPVTKPVRQSVSLPPHLAQEVKLLAKRRTVSESRVIVELIEAGLEAREREKERFFELADRLTESRDPEEQDRIKAELAHLTFGE